MPNLYLICRKSLTSYDEYDSAVVCADSIEEARRTEVDSYGWVIPRYVKVKTLGVAKDSIKKGVILASFNAG